MEMHQLRYAVAVARAGNFSRAAEQCHVAQPSLSQQILKLEEELGERLFERTKREARLTPHGEAFLHRAIRILEEVDAAKREANDAKDLLSGTVTLGVIPTIAPYLLPSVMAAFAKKYPGVEMIVHEEQTARLLKMLHGHEIDIALASLPLERERLEIRELFTEELLLALPRNHPLTRKSVVPDSELNHAHLIAMKEGHCLGDQLLNFCNRQHVRPKISFRSAQLETIQALVTAGVGMSLIPAMAIKGGKKNHPAFRSLGPRKPERSIVTAWPRRRPLGRAAEAFHKVLLSHLESKGGTHS
ncbi:MAG: LysR substrate-binding domain-containing protein [Verrucomicrobia bacterium]|nr:LysR substrate-binding domain-containing protein [Verrucomicrobiota bacterium]